MNIRNIPKADIGLIEPLWNALKTHQQQRTTLFDDYYLQISFEKPKSELLSMDLLLILSAGEVGSELGFCVASINHGVGEVESLYVKPESRDQQLGTTLMQHAMDWLTREGGSPVRFLVAEGNEEAISCYQKPGFRKQATMMELFK